MENTGYINQYGEQKIDFKYDYASPFIKINIYDKNFQIALVCENEKTSIIMKNGRIVKSYVSESASENYEEKIRELEKFYTKELKQTEPMEYEIEEIKSDMNKVPAYEETSSEYTYKYDFNNYYDVVVIQSSMGLGDTYYLVKKGDDKNKIQLECDNLCYDDKYLYVYRNGDLPYYNVNTKEQGWFNRYGRKTNMKGKAQILEIVDQTILLRNYNDNTVYFIDAYESIVSSIYKDIFVCNDGKYVVQNTNGKFTLIDSDYSQIFEEEYDFIDTSLARYGLFICGNFPEKLEANDFGYIKMNMKIIASNGQVVTDGVEQAYGTYYKLDNTIRDSDKRVDEFKGRLQNLDYEFIGDKFYSRYN